MDLATGATDIATCAFRLATCAADLATNALDLATCAVDLAKSALCLAKSAAGLAIDALCLAMSAAGLAIGALRLATCAADLATIIKWLAIDFWYLSRSFEQFRHFYIPTDILNKPVRQTVLCMNQLHQQVYII